MSHCSWHSFPIWHCSKFDRVALCPVSLQPCAQQGGEAIEVKEGEASKWVGLLVDHPGLRNCLQPYPSMGTCLCRLCCPDPAVDCIPVGCIPFACVQKSREILDSLWLVAQPLRGNRSLIEVEPGDVIAVSPRLVGPLGLGRSRSPPQLAAYPWISWHVFLVSREGGRTKSRGCPLSDRSFCGVGSQRGGR